MGPEYLRQLVLDARQQESASQHSSAAQSPAGDGRRLGGSFHNGSLEAFPEAGAALPAPDGGLRGATPTTSKPNKSYRPRADSGVDEAGYDMDQTLNTNPEPPHNSFFDEGVDVELDTSYDGYATSSGRAVVSDGGMSALASYHDPTWNFQAVDMDATSEGAVFDDAATNVAAPGSNMSDDLHDRLMTDFGDELHDSSTKRSCSPAFASSRDDTPMLPDEEGPINLKRPVDESEEELVAAVRVDEHDMGVESDAEKQGLSHRIEQ